MHDGVNDFAMRLDPGYKMVEHSAGLRYRGSTPMYEADVNRN